MKANKYLKDISNVDFAYSDIIAASKWFKNRSEEFFDSMEDLTTKIECYER